MDIKIFKEDIRDEDENKYSGIYMEQPYHLKYCHDLDHYLKFGNFHIYEEYLESPILKITFIYLIISHYKYYIYFIDLTYRTEIFEAFEAILKEEFKKEIRKEKIKQLDMLYNI